MNSPFVIQQSRNLLQRSEVVGVEAEDEKLRRLFRIMFQRQPEQDEIRLAHTFLAGQKSRRPRSSAPAAWESGYAGLQALVSQRMSRTPLREFSDRESGNNGDMRELDEFSDKDHFRSPLAEPAGVPSLTPWEKFAQVLLLTNELMFVD